MRFIIILLCCMGATWTSERPNIIVIFTDDMGYADLGCQGHVNDIRTPHLDEMAKTGVRFTNGYVTAPQCTPSRAGLLTGRYQQRFGLDHNGLGELPLSEISIAERLKNAGYETCHVGKWHLDTPADKKEHANTSKAQDYHPYKRGFNHVFNGQLNNYSATFDLAGNTFNKLQVVKTTGDRLDRQSDAAVQFITQHHAKPFFLYVAYFAPHVPLASSEPYLAKFPGDMPERRRLALAMINAVDNGVGRIMATLSQYKIDENTLIFFISDNGAPLKLTMTDLPLTISGGAWDGSMNTPLNGEKGMVSEGGIRVPFLARWPGKIPAGQVLDTPVISLDVAATVTNLAGIGAIPELDGVDLLPLLSAGTPLAERALFWRFWSQSAVRVGDWKLLRFADQTEWLFHIKDDMAESKNVIAAHPEIAERLRSQLTTWADTLQRPGVMCQPINQQEYYFYNHFFKTPLPANPGKNPFQ